MFTDYRNDIVVRPLGVFPCGIVQRDEGKVGDGGDFSLTSNGRGTTAVGQTSEIWVRTGELVPIILFNAFRARSDDAEREAHTCGEKKVPPDHGRLVAPRADCEPAQYENHKGDVKKETCNGPAKRAHAASLPRSLLRRMATPFFRASAETPSMRHFGMEPAAFQLDTVEGDNPSAEATELVPPRASIMAVAVMSSATLR